MNSFNGPFLVPLTPRAATIMATRRVNVSILTRPEGRMQRRWPSGNRAVRCLFQSSPGQKAGCNTEEGRGVLITRCFNPHPARRPDATVQDLTVKPLHDHVSILTRPEGRMQPAHLIWRLMFWMFQSSPGQKAGCNHRDEVQVPEGQGGSILTRPEGRMQPAVHTYFHRHMVVSILTWPEGRMQRPAWLAERALLYSVSILTRPEGRMQLLLGYS